MRPVISIGNQDFASIRTENRFYVDKTYFIRDWWENGDIVTLITRPRRFGKTLALSMMEHFFSCRYAHRPELFEGLSVWEDEKFRRLQGMYPVIFVSFADVKGTTYQGIIDGMVYSVAEAYRKHSYLLEGDLLTDAERCYFRSFEEYLLNIDADRAISEAVIIKALKNLSFYLNRYYGQKVLIFLDEYDTPLQEAYVQGFWERIAQFIRALFNATFKTNPYLERSLMTGITRVSKESIFSDLNNLEVVTVTSEKYETAFGFTHEEVTAALTSFGLSETIEQVRAWYDGFCFGSRGEIYNPWSITKYLDSGRFDSYWVNTSSNSLVSKLIQEGTGAMKIAVEDLLAGNAIEAAAAEELVFQQLDQNEEAIWSLLLASGYLKMIEKRFEDRSNLFLYRLKLTNREVQIMFSGMIRGWFAQPSAKYHDFIKALLANDLRYMNSFMNQMMMAVFSFFDSGTHPSRQSEPERFYHGFVLGLIADARINYAVTSNRESGFGRYDVVMEPRNPEQNAYVLEFKVHDPEREKNLEDTVQAALSQIVDKNYDAAIIAHGIPLERIWHYGFAFQGKQVLIGSSHRAEGTRTAENAFPSSAAACQRGN